MIQKTTLFFMLLISVNFYSQTVIVSSGANWNYLDDGSNQGTAWYGTGFNDASWNLNFPTELGYGDTQTTTVGYGPDANNKYPTTYFRKSFNVADHTLYSDLKLEAIRDDGMVVYLNGVMVWSDNMPASFDWATYASSVISGIGETTWISKIIGNSLLTGTNVIAVEIHQSSGSSSDISFDFRLTGYAAIPTAITRGPYLQTGTPTSVILKWKTNTSTESIINYGTSLGVLNATEQENTLKINHEITLTGLLPNTKYFYEIADLNGVYVTESSNMYVKTSPNVGEKQFVRAWILGDAGTANQDQRNVRDQYYNYVNTTPTNPNQTDMMLFLGDNAYNDGTDSEYQTALFDVYADMLKKSVAWSTLGNHDGHSATSSTQSGPYYDIFTFPKSAEAGGVSSGTEAYYSFDYANIHFIVLESHQLYNDATQMAWCVSDIQATSQDWIVALFHHPAYTKGSHDSDSETELIAMRNNFLPILEANGVDLILSGHSHSYERSYFINGHYGLSGTFNSSSHTIGTNGDLSGKANTADGAYTKTESDTEGAVYITTGSAGKISGGSLNHNAMYASLNQLGSCILEIENDGATNQNLNIKFLNDSGAITDYFTINKTGFTSSDLDDDGVMNNVDNCPDTPAGETVDVTGCSDSQKDDDGDGVMNDVDNCNDTPAGETADATGCSDSQLDDDNDGVMNNVDNCPDTPAGETADTNGCSDSQLDDDNDGVMNNVDNCPHTPTSETADTNGCSDSQKDDDGDGVTNDIDLYASTPSEAIVDINGGVIIIPKDIIISWKSPTCPNVNNANISIKINQNYSFDITVIGPSGYTNTSINKVLTNPLVLAELASGEYQIYFSFTEGLGANFSGYNLNISSAPEVAGKNTRTDKSSKTATFNVSGDKNYFIYVNDVYLRDASFNDELTHEIVVDQLLLDVNHVKIVPENICRGVVEQWLTLKGDIQFYPNPTDDLVTLNGLTSEEVTIQVYTTDSSMLFSENHFVNDGLVKFSLKHYPTGVYIVKVFANKKDTVEFKVIKK